MEIKVNKFFVPKKNVEAVRDALRGATSKRNIKTVQGGAQAFGWHVRESVKGDLIKLQCLRYNEEDTKKFVETMAPFVSEGTVVKVMDGGDVVRTFEFKVTEPEPEPEVKPTPRRSSRKKQSVVEEDVIEE